MSARMMFSSIIVQAAVTVCWLSTIALATLVDNGTVLTLNGIDYYAGGTAIIFLDAASANDVHQLAEPGSDFFPLTVVHTDVDNFGTSELNAAVARFAASDDVFQPAFLQSVYMVYNGTGHFRPNVTACTQELHALDTKRFMAASPSSEGIDVAILSTVLPNGPYLVSARTGAAHRAHSLYPDDFLAFTEGIVSDEQDGYVLLSAVTENIMAKSIAVPSRLYYTTSTDNPLAGLRVGVKDIYHIKGMKTGGGNRAYYYLYGTQNATGKTGAVQFANGDRVTADWVDVHCPFNPRGEGYQDPSGSSSGSGAAIGAYNWLDLAIGSDTGGSMRGPAGVQGLYENCPSTGAISMDHVIPLSPNLDTAGVLARSASLWSDAVHAWYANFTDGTSYPRRIVYCAESSGYNNDAETDNGAAPIVKTFISRMQDFLGAHRTSANNTLQWIDRHSPRTFAKISEVLYDTYSVLTGVDQLDLLGQPLFDDYAALHNGSRPFINPCPLVRWQWGQNHTSEYDAAVRNMTAFPGLVLDVRLWRVQQPHLLGGASTSILSISARLRIVTRTLARPHSRRLGSPIGLADWAVLGYAAAAELMTAVGEVPYEGTVSLKTDYLLVSVSVRVAHGCDLMLANLAKDLKQAGILKGSATGSRI